MFRIRNFTAANLSALQSGLTLVELVISIAVIGVGVAGILLTLNVTSRNSADPLLQKQALAIAEALLEEIELMPVTFCDPDDAQASTATGAVVGPPGAGCTAAATVEALGPETIGGVTENRFGGAASNSQFDNVSDYHGYNSAAEAPPGIKAITNGGAAVVGLGAYNASVAITPTTLGVIAAADSLRIAVTVTGPGNTVVNLEGFRTRYAPRAGP